LKFNLVGFAFCFSFDSRFDVLIFDHVVLIIDHVGLIRNKSHFGVDHGGVEVGSCKVSVNP